MLGFEETTRLTTEVPVCLPRAREGLCHVMSRASLHPRGRKRIAISKTEGCQGHRHRK